MVKMSRKLKKFLKTQEGKEMLEANRKQIDEEHRTKTGWFSKEEDEYWDMVFS